MVSSLVRDVRHGVRGFVKSPGFTLTAVLSLALGIGANSALFGMFNSLLWKPLPVEAPGELVVFYSRRDAQSFYQPFSYPEYRDYREATTVFTGVVGYSPAEMSLRTEGREDGRAYGELVTGNYFDVLGVPMALGRAFRPEEDAEPGAHPVVVLSHRLWERRFDADPSVVGRSVTLNGQPFAVIGVAPEGFRGAYAPYFAPDLWMPMAMVAAAVPSTTNYLEDREPRFIRLMGRLAPGVGVAEARAAVATIASRLAETYPETNRGVEALVFPELDTRPEVEISAAANAIAMTFLGITALVLLVACANVANLLLARAAGRRREIAVRLALGAGRRQLVRQLLVESLLLALGAGTLGLGLGAMATRLMSAYRVPTDLPLVMVFEADGRMVVFTLAVSVVAAVAFGMVPALRASRADLVPALKDGSPSAAAGGRRFGLTNVLVVAQVATSLVLLIAAGLFVKSVQGARTIDPGFSIDDRIVMSFNPRLQHYDAERTATFYQRLGERVRALPMVEDATLAQAVPLDFSANADNFIVEGRATEPGHETVQLMYSVVDERYFTTLATRVLRGRGVTAEDTATSRRVAVVNETMARQLWPDQDPLGKRFRMAGPDEPWIEVVGLAADGKYRQLTESPRPYAFLPAEQVFLASRTLVVHMRERADVASTVAAVRREVQAIDPTMPIFDVKTMDQFMERAYLGPKLAAYLIGPAGVLALVIAAIGLYGVMAYWVGQRTREVGIRVAIGARPADVFRLVMGQGLALAAIGLALGLAGAFAASRVVAGLLFGVSPTDPLVFAGVPVLLAAVAAVASWVPARRALKVDPLLALRAE